jgi:hypothetical protein
MTTIVTRAGKGSALSFSEMDANFSNLNNDKAETGGLPSFLARAWVNFNGQGTVAIRASGNVSSITDLGIGSYRVNFTTAMPDTNYAIFHTNDEGITPESGIYGTRTTSAFDVYSYLRFDSYTTSDAAYENVVVFR